VFVGGRIVDEGGPELAETLEAEGYEKWIKAAAGAAA
jgi:Fe-S cluster assembly ATP-binding protein